MIGHAIIIGAQPRRNATPRGAASGADNIERDIAANFYPTPPEATRALLSVEDFDGDIWEPACGKGHIARVLEANGYRVVSTDLHDLGYGTAGIDFLAERRPRARHIVTNPPYGIGLADDFTMKALAFTAHTGGKVAMLLNLASLAQAGRTRFWRTLTPARIWAIDSVVCWGDPRRVPPRHLTAHRYCWCVWEGDHDEPTRFGWLSAAEFRHTDDGRRP